MVMTPQPHPRPKVKKYKLNKIKMGVDKTNIVFQIAKDGEKIH